MRSERCLLLCLLVACRSSGDLAAPSAGPATRTTRLPARAAPPSLAGAISGTVIDAGGRPVGGARVALVPIGLFDPSGSSFARARSARDGSFRFSSAGDARYGVTATALDGEASAWVADVGAGTAGLTLQLDSRGRHLSGRVIDRRGRPRSGAEVRIARGLGEAGDVFLVDSATNGRWSASVPAGEYHASAVRTGELAAQVALPAGLDSVDLVLEPVGPPGPAPRAVVDWLRAHAAPLATVEPGRGLDDLASLRAVVGDARVVGLGEVTHGTREIFQVKHRVLEHLVAELGFTVFAIELALPESFAIDDYVLGGRGDPEMLLAGQLVSLWQTEELRDLLRWMREWNRTHARKLRFHGIDMRTGVRAARDVIAYLRRVDRDELASPAGRALTPIACPVAYQDVVRRPKPELAALAVEMRGLVERLERGRASYVARSSADAWWRATAEARVLAQMLAWRAAGDTAERVRIREQAMAENAMRALERHGRGARAVVWAHNAHVAGNAEAAPRMMGVHLRGQLGLAYRAFGTVLGRGSYQAVDHTTMLPRTSTVAPSARPGSIEHTLARAGHPLAAFDLREVPQAGAAGEWLRAFQPFHQFDGLYDDDRPQGWASPHAILTRDYDAVLFVAEGTVARGLPLARAVDLPAPLAAPANLQMEEAQGGRPRAWRWLDARAAVCGYEVALHRRGPLAGRASARIARTRRPRYGECAGQLSQIIDGAPYRGKRVRVSAQVRVERAGEHAHLLARSGGQRTSALAVGRSPVRVELDVPDDAAALEIGLAFDGEGAALFDAVSVEILP
jgi:erythromycin esterase